MEFKTKAHEEIYQKIAGYMKDLFGEFARPRPDDTAFGITVGSAYVYSRIYPWGEDEAVINTRSYVITKCEIVPELMEYLLTENDTMRFGAFGLDKDKDIFFEHAILGSTCDKEELKASVMAVIYTADKYDDTIHDKWGGLRAEDR